MAKLNVGKWQAARRAPSYTPVLQFFYRQIWMAMFEALRVKGQAEPYSCAIPDEQYGRRLENSRSRELWDAAIMARNWIASAAPDPEIDREGWVLSFDAACIALGLQPDYERTWMLEKIDAAADFDTDEVWARIEYLTDNPPDETEEPLFDAPRVVPALDQGCLFGNGGLHA